MRQLEASINPRQAEFPDVGPSSDVIAPQSCGRLPLLLFSGEEFQDHRKRWKITVLGQKFLLIRTQ